MLNYSLKGLCCSPYLISLFHHKARKHESNLSIHVKLQILANITIKCSEINKHYNSEKYSKNTSEDINEYFIDPAWDDIVDTLHVLQWMSLQSHDSLVVFNIYSQFNIFYLLHDTHLHFMCLL